MREQVMTPKQAATYIGVSDQTIYNWLAADIIKGVMKKGLRLKKPRYLIPLSEVERVKLEGNYGLVEDKKNGLAARA